MTTAAFHLWSLTNKRSQPPNNMKKRKLMIRMIMDSILIIVGALPASFLGSLLRFFC